MVKEVEKARDLIQKYILKTQTIYAEKISKKYGGKVFLKLENTQISGSFKVRGAFNKLLSMNLKDLQNGVIAASAGNHAQGVAAAATALKIPSTIIMPIIAPAAKINSTQEYGGKVILHGDSFDESLKYARSIARKEKMKLIHAFDDQKIIEGQATIGLEILEQLDKIDQVIIPIGGGGLIAGIATIIKEKKPSIKIIGVQTEKVSPMLKSFLSHKYNWQKSKPTIADGIAVGKPGHKTFKYIDKYVDQILTVSEEDIFNAILFLLEKCKIISEGAGCVTVAAIMNNKIRTSKKNTVAVISGGNIDVTILESIINKSLILNKRRFEIKMDIKDKTGEISKIFNVIAKEQGSVHDIKSGYFRDQVNPGQQAITIVLDVRDKKHMQKIILELRKIPNSKIRTNFSKN